MGVLVDLAKDLAIVEALSAMIKNAATSEKASKAITKIAIGGKSHGEEKFVLASLGMAELEDGDRKALFEALIELMDEAIGGDKEKAKGILGFMLMLSSNAQMDEQGNFIHAGKVWETMLLKGREKDILKKNILRAGHNFRDPNILDKLKELSKLPIWGEIWEVLSKGNALEEKITEATGSLRSKTAAWRAKRTKSDESKKGD